MTFDEPKKLRGANRIAAEAEQAATAFMEQREAVLSKLANMVETAFCDRARKRVDKDLEWQRALALYHAPLVNRDMWEKDDPFKIPTRRARPTPNIIRTKCDAAIANGYSMQFASGEKNWDIWPAANDDSPESAVSCKLMEKEIETQLDGCRYPLTVRRAMTDRVIFGTGVTKGPVNTGKLRRKYVKQGDTWVPVINQDFTPSIEYVPVYRFYPDMNVASHKSSMSDIELHPMTLMELAQLRYNPGFRGDVILEILDDKKGSKPLAYNTEVMVTITDAIWESPYMHKDRYTVLEYHGPISASQFEDIGMELPYEAPGGEYYGEIWTCCGKVIRIELENIEGACETPYAVSVWKEDPRSPFGFGHPLLLADAQRVVTQSYHMILDNASLTSGPQVAMYKNFIQPADGKYILSPNKVWLLNDPSVKISDAIDFFTPSNVINNIMPVLQLAKAFAEEESATTGQATGLDSPQNADTATGQLVSMQRGTPILDFMNEGWDDDITEKNIRRMYDWNMQYNPKDEIKGDYSIDVRSSSDFKNKQIHVRDLEKLSMEAAQNPQLAMWLNIDELQRARLSLMTLPYSKIVRTPEEYAQAVQAMQEQQQSQPDLAMMELQLKQAQALREEKKLALDEARLQFEILQQQQREQWEHEEKMSANMARLQEAEASVIKARTDQDTELIKLAAKQDQAVLDAETKMAIEQTRQAHAAFLAGIDSADKQMDQMLVQEELQIKKQGGTGI